MKFEDVRVGDVFETPYYSRFIITNVNNTHLDSGRITRLYGDGSGGSLNKEYWQNIICNLVSRNRTVTVSVS